MTLKKLAGIVIPTIALAIGVTGNAQAGINLVTNGGFEDTSSGAGQIGPHGNTSLTGWTSTAVAGNNSGYTYNFVYASGTLDTTGTPNSQFGGVLKMWGSHNGGLNVLPASSQNGGNFVAADGAYENGKISQTLTGLTLGASYIVSFDWAAAQQYGFTGNTTEAWKVSFGGQTKETTVVTNPSHGFTPWMQTSMTFTADGTSDVLSFLAVGTPSGEPPFVLLDGVTAFAVPEPSTVVLMGLGMLGIAVVKLRRRARSVSVVV